MKKTFCLTLICVILSLSLFSCDFNLSFDELGNRDSEEETVVMYGVGVHLEDLNNTCIYFASSGHITMPRLQSGEPSPEFEAGDLIKVSFTADKNGIPIMESFPGQFGIGADEIAVKPGTVNYYSSGDKKTFTDKIPENFSLEIGNTIVFSSVTEGKEKNIAEGLVTEVSDGFYTVELSLCGSEEDFFKYLFEYGFNLTKK